MLGIKISDLDPIPIHIFTEILNLSVNGTFILEGTQIRSKNVFPAEHSYLGRYRGLEGTAPRALLA
jgi:hypothetical protein